MNLLFYSNKIKIISNKLETEITKNISKSLHLNNYVIFDAFKWIFMNSIQSISFSLRLKTFLKKNFYISSKIRNQNSRIHLVKMRIENSLSDSLIFSKWINLNYIFKPKIYSMFNHLQVVPWNKYIYFNKANLQTLFWNIYKFNKNLVVNRVSFYKKKNIFFLNFNPIFNYSMKKVDIRYPHTSESIFMEKINLFFENICTIISLLNLVTFRRNSYTKNVLLFLIKLNLLKTNYFKDILIVGKNKKISKINPYFNNFLKSEKNKLVSFIKICVLDFKILPSKNKIPLQLYVEMFGNVQNFKKQILKNNVIGNFQVLNIKFQLKKKSFIYKLRFFIEKYWNVKREIYLHQTKSWLEKKNNINKGIDISLVKKWSIEQFLIKESNDFNNETVGIMLISQLDKLFREEFLDLWLNSFLIYPVYSTSGLINIVPNSISLHDLNKRKYNHLLKNKFMKKIQYNFVESLASYSLFCFIFQLKDRHNGNILINSDNRIIHVDFGYLLGYIPGNLRFEADSFKFSRKFLLEINGKKSEKYEYFRELFIRGFISLKKNFVKIVTVLKIILFQKKNVFSLVHKLKNLEKRLKISVNEKCILKYTLNLIQESVESWKTLQYDKYQLHASGIN